MICGEWEGFNGGAWQDTIDVRDFIQKNYVPYGGGGEFLCGPTERTKKLLSKLERLLELEQSFGGVLDIDTQTVTSPMNYKAGYLDKENEIIVGLQTDRPLKRGVNPFGGIAMTRKACEAYGYSLSEKVEKEFQYRTTHNDGVFRVYSDEIKTARHCGIITGLPDSYGRGRIIGDYRRAALYGVDRLIEEKKRDKARVAASDRMLQDEIRLLEELYQQINFLGKLKEMAALYGFDISRPASCAREAVQWLYFAYLAAIKEQNGAAMSLGRVSTFLDIYRTRHEAWHSGRERRAGDNRRLRDEAAHGAPPPHARVQRALCGRPDVDNGGAGRYGRGRADARDENYLQDAEHTVQPRPLGGAEPDRAVV